MNTYSFFYVRKLSLLTSYIETFYLLHRKKAVQNLQEMGNYLYCFLYYTDKKTGGKYSH
jgi:hypothetical protein